MTVEGKVKLEKTIRIHEERKQELVVSKVYGCFGSMGCRAFASNCHIFTFKRKWFHIKSMSLLRLYFITFNVYGVRTSWTWFMLLIWIMASMLFIVSFKKTL